MESESADLDQLQGEYKAAVEAWIAAIREEEALASVNHTLAQIDLWEKAGFQEDDLRQKVKTAKAKYESAIRQKFFNFS